MDLWDADLVAVKAATLADCFTACAATAGCGAFTLVASWGECYLKTASGWRRQSLKGAQSVVVVPCNKTSAAVSAAPAPAGRKGRRLAAADATSLRPLALPVCAYGSGLNFVGSWSPAGRKVRRPAGAHALPPRMGGWRGQTAHVLAGLKHTPPLNLQCSARATWWHP